MAERLLMMNHIEGLLKVELMKLKKFYSAVMFIKSDSCYFVFGILLGVQIGFGGISVKKIYCIIAQLILLLWFFLDMTGLCFGNNCLVSRSYKDDGIFFLIYLIVVILFIVKEQIGKWFVIVWLSMWFAIQFICHEWYTIFNDGFMGTLERKIEYFSGTIQWLQLDGKYIPDVYHTILHILILCALISTIVYSIKITKKK